MNEKIDFVIEQYIESSSSLVKDLEDSLKTEDNEKLFISSHSLKSASLQVGAETLSDLARQIEAIAREDDTSEVKQLCKELSTEHKSVIHSLQNIKSAN